MSRVVVHSEPNPVLWAIMKLGHVERDWPNAIMLGFNHGLRFALRFSVTDFMVPLGVGRGARPPNPPPGPLGIRSGRLRRGVRIYEARRTGTYTYEGGLLSTEPYGPIHEFGGKIRRWNQRKGTKRTKKTLRVIRSGITIPPRPYMRPALEKALPIIAASIEREMVNAIHRHLG
jgi:phage gpG-like protein